MTTYIQSRSYRAPEVVLGCKYDARIDVWSMGAVLAELHTGYVLFQNDSLASMLARITGILGQFPESVLQSGTETNKFFTLSNIAYEAVGADGVVDSARNSGAVPHSYNLVYPKKTTLAKRLHLAIGDADYVQELAVGNLTQEQVGDELLFLDFVKKLLLLDHKKRVNATEALRHPWLAHATDVNINDFTYVHNVSDMVDNEEDVDPDDEIED